MTQRNEALSIATGIFLLALCHVAFAALCFLLFYVVEALGLSQGDNYYDFNFTWAMLYALLGIGLTQILYAVPLYIRLKKKGLADTAKGVAIGAVLTLLLNGSCFILIL